MRMTKKFTIELTVSYDDDEVDPDIRLESILDFGTVQESLSSGELDVVSITVTGSEDVEA